MNKTQPYIEVKDLEAIISWYSDFLGFECISKTEDYALLEKDDSHIYLARDASNTSYGINIIAVETNYIESTYAELETRGVVFTKPIGVGPLGFKQFSIKDYEENEVVYIERSV